MSILTVLTIIKLVHIVSASLWVGGILFTVIVNRRLRKTYPPVEATKMLGVVGRAIQRPMRYSLYLAVVSGLFILLTRGFGVQLLTSLAFYATHLGMILLIKMILTVAVLLMLPLHSRLGRRLYEMEDGPEYSRDRLKMLVVGWATLCLTLAIIAMGTLLRFS
ncbi:MAG: hypothetical protein QXM16_00785 [Nitrososphaerota archaeon]